MLVHPLLIVNSLLLQGNGINDADDDSSAETVLIAGSPVPPKVLNNLSDTELERLLSKYTDTYIPTTGYNEFVNYREELINELLYQHKIYTGEIAADYGGDEIRDRYDLDDKKRVLRWFQHQNNQVEESSIGVSLLPEIMERVKTECGGVAPSVKGNLSILFSILNESQVFKRNFSWVGLSKLQKKVDTSGEVNGIDVDGMNINGECSSSLEDDDGVDFANNEGGFDMDMDTDALDSSYTSDNDNGTYVLRCIYLMFAYVFSFIPNQQ